MKNMFRGRRSHDKQWVYGNLVIDNSGEKHIVPADFFSMDGHHLRYDDDTDKPVFFDQETIGQFTGQMDESGNRIYSGDKLKDEAGNVAPVLWNECDCSFIIDFETGCEQLDSSVKDWGTVSGTMYD